MEARELAREVAVLKLDAYFTGNKKPKAFIEAAGGIIFECLSTIGLRLASNWQASLPNYRSDPNLLMLDKELLQDDLGEGFFRLKYTA